MELVDYFKKKRKKIVAKLKGKRCLVITLVAEGHIYYLNLCISKMKIIFWHVFAPCISTRVEREGPFVWNGGDACASGNWHQTNGFAGAGSECVSPNSRTHLDACMRS